MQYTWHAAAAPAETCRSKDQSQSQLSQDLWALEQSQCKQHGYYIDIGSHDGQVGSNTAVLDNTFGWQGLCIDINPFNMDRRSCAIEKCVLYDKAGETVQFKQPSNDSGYSGFAGIKEHIKGERHMANTEFAPTVSHVTKTAQDVFDAHKVPKRVDFLDMDVEGAELKILQGMERQNTFAQHCFDNITIEHNFIEPERSQIRELLERHGYQYAGTEVQDDRYHGPCDEMARH
jgi:FkbM family methyltransferase